MTSVMLKQTRLTILLSLNAVAIVIAGILIASAIGLNEGIEFRVVSEYSDVTDQAAPGAALFEGETAYALEGGKIADGISDEPVAGDQLWNENEISMYQTANYDLCVGGGLTDIGEMYWQTSNPNVISGFYATARTWLGYDSKTCKYPIITGTGTTTITAGTYDGARHDSINLTVVSPPIDEWRHEVLDVVNKERVNNKLPVLSWGETCEAAASLRAEEIVNSYSHTRPSGTQWSTACPIPSEGGVSGENIAIGNAAVSPATVVALWMNSPEHRANILNGDFTKLSVGFTFDPSAQYQTYWSQYFTNY